MKINMVRYAYLLQEHGDNVKQFGKEHRTKIDDADEELDKQSHYERDQEVPREGDYPDDYYF